MLLKTTAEVKALLPKLLARVNNNALMPNFDRTEQKYLLPLIGKDLYDQFIAIYNAGNAAGALVQILKNMQLVAASYGYLDEMATMHATITDAGIQTANTAAMPRVYGWEYKELKKGLQDAAADAVDVLLQSLWLNKADLPAWTGSDAYTQFNSLLIKTGFDFNERHVLFQPQRTFYAIKSLVRDVQEQLIAGAIGDSLVEYFVANAALTAKETACLKSIQSALAFYSVKRACEHYSIRMSDAGFTIVEHGDPENSDAAGRTADAMKGGFLMLKMQACERDGAAYLAKAKKDLVALSKDLDAAAGFIAAFSESPLVGYDPTKKRDLGNCRRKGTFRL